MPGHVGVNELSVGFLGVLDLAYCSTNIVGQFVACTGILLQVSRYET